VTDEVMEGCPAEVAAGLMTADTDRVTAVQLAERALSDEDCAQRSSCVRSAVATLLGASQFGTVDAHLLRLADQNLHSDKGLLSLLRAQLNRLVGELPLARRQLAVLSSARVAAKVKLIARLWLVETLMAEGRLTKAQVLAKKIGIDQLIADRPPQQALLLATRGALQLAEGRYRLAIADFLACGPVVAAEDLASPVVARRRAFAALAAEADGNQKLAMALAAEERAAALRWGEPARIGWALFVQAVCGDRRDRLELLAEAASLLDAVGARTELATVRYELGRHLAHEGDPTRARENLARVADLARGLNNHSMLDQAQAAFGAMGSSFDAAPLTKQELKIAKLVRAGHSNKQIAERTSLNVRTVEFHLSNVYRKLRISGRRDLLSGNVILQ
jgi:DNA-binding CsgD family transcriptional regulator